MKTLSELRDNLPKKIRNGWPERPEISVAHVDSAVSVAFDVGAKAVMEEASKLAEILDQIEGSGNEMDLGFYNKKPIRGALARWQAFVGRNDE